MPEARMHVSDRADQILAKHRLEKIINGACFEGTRSWWRSISSLRYSPGVTLVPAAGQIE
jgi:hypothetical protein